MMINRNNYEEFFLLYADDELNHQQRAGVELFVKQNPDMAAELETLQQMKLVSEDNLVFPGKSSLYKTTDVDININNYSGFFFLYIDRELDETARGKVEKFVLQHPQLQEEFTLLKQTVLQPEAVVFADKSSLYRKEERKIAFLSFARLAIAAAVIGIAVLGWWLYPTGVVKPVNNNVVVKQTTIKPAVKPNTKLPAITPPQQQNVQQNTAGVDTKKVQKQGNAIKPIQKVTNNIQQAPAVVKTQNDNMVVNVPKQDAARVIDTTVIVAQETAPIAEQNNANTVAATGNPPAEVTTQVTTAHSNSEDGVKNPPKDVVAVNVPYKVIDTDDEDRSMYVGSLELNKDKIKGFFKRAGRIFGSRAKKDTD